MSDISRNLILCAFALTLAAVLLDMRTDAAHGPVTAQTSLSKVLHSDITGISPGQLIQRILGNNVQSSTLVSHDDRGSFHRRKRNVLYPSGVKLCSEETEQQAVANHLSYFHLRVCQEMVWEAFQIFWDRLPDQEEYQSWMNQCQDGSATALAIGNNFSQSDEHLALVQSRMPPTALRGDPANSWVRNCSTTTLAQNQNPGPASPDEAVVEAVTEAIPVVAVTVARPITNDIEVLGPPPRPVLDQAVELSILLPGETYSEELRDPASLRYQNLHRHFTEKIEGALERLPGFKSVAVIEFKLQRDVQGLGGVEVHYAVTLEVEAGGVSSEQLDYLTLQSNRVENSYGEVEERPHDPHTQALGPDPPHDTQALGLHPPHDTQALGPDPDPLGPNPEPLGPNPDPLGPNPDPLGPNPDPLGPNPDPLGPNPDPLGPHPDPLGPHPDPLQSESVAASLSPSSLQTTPDPPDHNHMDNILAVETPPGDEEGDDDDLYKDDLLFDPAMTFDPSVGSDGAVAGGENDIVVLAESATRPPESDPAMEEAEDMEHMDPKPIPENIQDEGLLLENPPAENPPAENPPAENPPAENLPNLPAENPPAENLPAENPPAENLPAENPPAENPPAENPPAENLPAENPPAENLPNLPAENPPAENPPAENPPAENPPAENPPAENPPAENPPAENPPGDTSSFEPPGGATLPQPPPSGPTSGSTTEEEAGEETIEEEVITGGDLTIEEEVITGGDLTIEEDRAEEEEGAVVMVADVSTITTETIEDEAAATFVPIAIQTQDAPVVEEPVAVATEFPAPDMEISITFETPELSLADITEAEPGSDPGSDLVHYDGAKHTEEESSGFFGLAHGVEQASIAMPINPSRALLVFFSLRVTNMMFSDDLFNKNSPEYKALEQRFLELLVPYLQSNLSNFQNLEILNFRNGSIVVNSRMKFGKPVARGTTSSVYLILEDFCNTAYQTMNLAIDKYSLDVESGDQADPCKFQACNEFSACSVNRWSGEAECVCKAGYFSVDGRPCQSTCDLRTDFCLNDGKCDIIPGKGAICRCRVGENWWYRGEHCEEYVSEPLVVGIAIASVAGFLLVASGVIFFLARTLRDQYDKDESEAPLRQRESLPSLESATKYNPMYESDPTTGYSHYYRRYPEAPVYSSASAEASTDFSSEEMRHIYENSELTKEEIQDRIRIIELYAKDRQFADFVRQHQV